MEEDQRLFKEGKSFVNEQEKQQKKLELVRDSPDTSHKLLDVGFLFEAIKLNQMSFRMIL